MINAQPARHEVIDTLNSVWFDFLLLSAEIWGRADSFCVGQKWPLTSLCEMWRLLLDTWGFLELSQLAHVNWRNPRLLKWKTDFEDYLKEQSRRLCSFFPQCVWCSVTPLIVLLCFTFVLFFAAAHSGCALLLHHLYPPAGSISMPYVKTTQL